MPFVTIATAVSYQGADGITVVLDRIGIPVQIEVDGTPQYRSVTIEDGNSLKIFDADEAPGGFDVLMLLVDTDGVDVELRTDQNAGVGRMVFTISPIANVPVFLDPRSMANYTADFATGTADSIERVTVKNSTGEDVKVTILTAS